jgi:hypothetical protein
MPLTIEDMIASGALAEHKTGGTTVPGQGSARTLTVKRPLNDEEKEVWEAYRTAVQSGKQP